MVYTDAVAVCIEENGNPTSFCNITVYKKDVSYYIQLILEQKTTVYLYYSVRLMWRELKPNDIVKINKDKIGIILPPAENFVGALRYKLQKKDKTFGVKIRILYDGYTAVKVKSDAC